MKTRLVNSKTVFIISLIILLIVVISTWILGIKDHRSVESNGIISLSILSIFFFFFITVGLYKGIKLRDGLGNLLKYYSSNSDIDGSNNIFDALSDNMPDTTFDGDESIIGSIIMWIFITILLGILLWIFGTIFWLFALILIGMLYWVFFRALRLVFKKSSECKGDLNKSIYYSFIYTLLYSGWIFGLLFIIKIMR